ncbi:MAG: hypothetical protein HQL31_08985, partial [Planctomycetes bacterium]|nr:hypothetical protein [Planctomycetota bacterium]
SGSGNIRADGGASSGSGGGGGGRVAVVLSSGGSDFSAFTGRITAYGGDSGGRYEDGAAGTIYLETPAQGAGAGNLIIDNNNLAASGGIYTLMPATVNLNDFSEIILRNGGDLAVDGDDLLDFSSVSLACNGRDEAFLTIVDGTGVIYPADYSIAGYTLNLLGDHAATGNWTVTNTGAISHCRNGTTELYKTHLTLSGNLTVENGGLIHTDGKGSPPGQGQGKPVGANVYSDGGSYGGAGGDSALNGGVGAPYGNVYAPVNIGSGGVNASGADSYAGGAIRLTLSGELVVNGQLSSDGLTSGASGAGGSGGSVYITCAAISGTGNIHADGGGSSVNNGGGGGGRVAIILTSAGNDFTGFTSPITAYGGSSTLVTARGTAGSVYLQTAAQAPSSGILIIDNNGYAFDGLVSPELPDSVVLNDFSEIIIRNGGILGLGNDDILDFSSVTLSANGRDEAYGTILGAAGLPFPSNYNAENYTMIIDTPLSIPGSFTVAANAALSHSRNYATQAYTMDLTVGGNLTVDSGGYIAVDGKGFYSRQGLGKSTSGSDGGGYGGRGGDDGKNGVTGGIVYGNITGPVALGSGGYSLYLYAGGAVKLTVDGITTLNGDITARSTGATDATGSGGSIWLSTGSLVGSGNMQADAGSPTTALGGGGGGRIAVMLTAAGADFSAYGGNLSAYGGDSTGANEDGAGGTVYRQLAVQGSGNGELIIENPGRVCYSAGGIATQITSSVTGRDVGDVIIRSDGELSMSTVDAALTVSGNWTNSSNQTLTAGTITFDGNASHLLTSGGGNFYNLVFSSAAEGMWTPQDTLTVFGNANFRAGLLNGGSQAILFKGDTLLSGGNFQTGTGAISLGDAAGDAFTMTSGNFYINGDDPDADITLTAAAGSKTGGVIHYTGSSCSAVLTSFSPYWGLHIHSASEVFAAGDDIEVNGDLELTAGTMNMAGYDLHVAGTCTLTGGSLILGGGNLTVDGNLTVYGDLEAGVGASTIAVGGNLLFSGGNFVVGSSNVLLSGSASQMVTSGGMSYNALGVSNTSGEVHFADTFTTADFICASAGAELIFEAGTTFVITDTLTLSGSYFTPIALDSSDGATQFILNLTSGSNQEVNFLTVGNSACSGADIRAHASVGRGTDADEASPHWVFLGTWTGAGADNNWSTPANWVDSSVPNEEDFAIFDATSVKNCTIDTL